jgi:hypothetical protein
MATGAGYTRCVIDDHLLLIGPAMAGFIAPADPRELEFSSRSANKPLGSWGRSLLSDLVERGADGTQARPQRSEPASTHVAQRRSMRRILTVRGCSAVRHGGYRCKSSA